MNMKIVIQCAAGKQPGGFWRTDDGRVVKFVAHPELAPTSAASGFVFAHPDGPAEHGRRSWRELVMDYNRGHENPSGIFQAFELYAPPTYAVLVRKFGLSNIFILSAGWGLIPATYMTPNYDITFSAGADDYKRRKRSDVYRDLNALTGDEPILFLGGQDYLPLFCALTEHLKAPRFVYFNSTSKPDVRGCHTIRYSTTRRTNWHYSCAEDLVNDKLDLPSLA